MNIIRYSSLMTLRRNESRIMLNDIAQGIKREYPKKGVEKGLGPYPFIAFG